MAQEWKITARIPSVLTVMFSPIDWLCKPWVENFIGCDSKFQRAPLIVTDSHNSSAKIENSSPAGMRNSRALSWGCNRLVIPVE